jgi:hypothetical protein
VCNGRLMLLLLWLRRHYHSRLAHHAPAATTIHWRSSHWLLLHHRRSLSKAHHSGTSSSADDARNGLRGRGKVVGRIGRRLLVDVKGVGILSNTPRPSHWIANTAIHLWANIALPHLLKLTGPGTSSSINVVRLRRIRQNQAPISRDTSHGGRWIRVASNLTGAAAIVGRGGIRIILSVRHDGLVMILCSLPTRSFVLPPSHVDQQQLKIIENERKQADSLFSR